MSEYQNDWSSQKDNNNQIKKLDEKQTYQIKDVEKLKAAFGKNIF